MDTRELVLHNPGSWPWQKSATCVTIQALVASVQCEGLTRGFHQEQDGPRQSLESQKLVARGTWNSNREPGCLAILGQQTSCGFLSSQGLLVREQEVASWPSVSHQGSQGGPCPMYNSPKRKIVARPEFLPGPRSDSRQGQFTSVEEWPYKGPLNWLPDRCCRMEGLVLAASPSFLQTTLHISRTMAFSFSLRSSSQLS